MHFRFFPGIQILKITLSNIQFLLEYFYLFVVHQHLWESEKLPVLCIASYCLPMDNDWSLHELTYWGMYMWIKWLCISWKWCQKIIFLLSDGLSLLTYMDYPKYGILTLILIYWIISAKMLYSKKKANFFSLKTPQGRCPVWVDSSFKAPWLPCNIEECVIIAREWQRGEDHILAFKCFYTEMKKKKSHILLTRERHLGMSNFKKFNSHN